MLCMKMYGLPVYVYNKMSLWNTNTSIRANSKDSQGHKEKYLDTSMTILSKEMLMCNMKALIFILKNNETKERSYHKEYSYEISKL